MKTIQKVLDLTKRNRTLVENFSYISLMQVFLVIAPLITYPYLVKVLGSELYGVVLTAQMLVSYFILLIDFGSNDVCAKYVSLNRDNTEKLSEIVSSVLYMRFLIFCICFAIYVLIVLIIPSYRENFAIFILMYGIAMNDLFFPRYFFQGMEKMKYITLINISTKLFFIAMVFIVVKSENHVIWVPILYSMGYIISGAMSLLLMKNKFGINLYRPKLNNCFFYVKESIAILAAGLVSTIKDKVNYFMVGLFVSMSNVVIYDLGLKIMNLCSYPASILGTVLFPRFAKNRNIRYVRLFALFIFFVTVILICFTNLFLNEITMFFIHKEIDLLPLRIFLISPIFYSVSIFLANSYFIAFNHSKYIFYSIIVTTFFYLMSLLILVMLGQLNSLMSFVALSLISYMAEFVYRVYKAYKLSNI